MWWELLALLGLDAEVDAVLGPFLSRISGPAPIADLGNRESAFCIGSSCCRTSYMVVNSSSKHNSFFFLPHLRDRSRHQPRFRFLLRGLGPWRHLHSLVLPLIMSDASVCLLDFAHREVNFRVSPSPHIVPRVG